MKKSFEGNHKAKNAQQIVEFIFLFPILIMLFLAIFEISMFWQQYNATQMVNEEVGANIILEDYSAMEFGKRCVAVAPAVAVLQSKTKVLAPASVSFQKEPVIVEGDEPFASYEILSEQKMGGKPVVKLSIDCRNPMQNGITTQLSSMHRVMFFAISLPNFSGKRIEIIPKNAELISTKNTKIGHI